MKLFHKIVAVAVIAVLAGFPAMARVMCAEGMAAKAPCKPHCPMAMGANARGCSMPFQAGRTGCDENCCQNGMQQGVFRADGKARALKADLVAILPAPVLSEGTVFASQPGDGRVDTGPPRYILFQVFRI
jgi:hypothetical protein